MLLRQGKNAWRLCIAMYGLADLYLTANECKFIDYSQMLSLSWRKMGEGRDALGRPRGSVFAHEAMRRFIVC